MSKNSLRLGKNYKILYVIITISMLLVPTFIHQNTEARVLTIRGYNGMKVTDGLTIQGKSFKLSGYSNNIPTTIVTMGQNITLKLHLWDDEGHTWKKHEALYTNLRGQAREVLDSDTFIIFDTDKPIQVNDPNGLFSKINLSTAENGNYIELNYDIVFAKPMQKSDIIIRTWDQAFTFKAEETKIFDALEVKEEVNLSSPPETLQIKQKEIDSPLKQLKSGIDPYKIECKSGLQKAMKPVSHSPVCVKPATLKLLLLQGWTQI